ncbi:MAG: PEP/pyruvate-binding domain-containing protein [Syntrophobacteraceae bacterium]
MDRPIDKPRDAPAQKVCSPLSLDIARCADDYELRIRTFNELMARKITDILLVSSLYDYCIMEEDGRLAERIIHEYRGLNLSKPPRITWVSSREEALAVLESMPFQLVITMPRLSEKDPGLLVQEIKDRHLDLPVILLTHRSRPPETCQHHDDARPAADAELVWSGNTDLLLAQIKNVEDRWNVDHDTWTAGVRVILFVEDSPFYRSSMLPILYREIVSQTQAAIEEGLNEEHRLLTMRSRAKILTASTFEEAVGVLERFKPYLLGVISDVRFPRGCALDDGAGLDLLRFIKSEIPDLPLCLTSSELGNKPKADAIPASFIDKSSPSLHEDIRSFLLHLGFGDFVFRMPDGREVGRASSRRALERVVTQVPLESFVYHANRNDFSRWLFARSEVFLAQHFRPISGADFGGDMERTREHLSQTLAIQRKWRQKGVVVDFDASDFDLDTEFLKVGRGSLGGKARGLVFASNLLKRNMGFASKYPQLEILIPPSLIVTTEAFDAIVERGDLQLFSKTDAPNDEIAARFLNTPFPEGIARDLRAFLLEARYPLAVRSSSLFEDAQFQAYAGLYKTFMLPNDHPDIEERLRQLIAALLLVHASTYSSGPKAFTHRMGKQTEEEKMAVIVQRLMGRSHRGFFYPTLAGVAQSHNFYPFGRARPEDGCATIALGLGKTVVEGGSAIRFCPRHPRILPQFSSVDDILRNAQRLFFALRMGGGTAPDASMNDLNLVGRDVAEAEGEPPLMHAASSYIPEENRVRDVGMGPGFRVVTFANILKHQSFPLASLLSDLLSLAEDGMGAPVEIEFAADPLGLDDGQPIFAITQVRPMSARAELMEVTITDAEISRALCYSTQALGNTLREDVRDLLLVKRNGFDPARTVDMAREIGHFNARLVAENRPYILVGPGRWGSADRWLGIPVTWNDISGVAAMIECASADMKAEPSQGSHFFHNVTTLGISYLTVASEEDFLHWAFLESLPVLEEREFVAHVRLERPLTLMVDGRVSRGVILGAEVR